MISIMRMRSKIANPKTVRYLHNHLHAIVLTWDDTSTVSIDSKTRSNMITSQLIRPCLYDRRRSNPVTTSTYASWSVGMEALLRAQRIWKCTLIPRSGFHDNFGRSHCQEERRDSDQVRQSTWKSLVFVDTQGSIGSARILNQYLFTDPLLDYWAGRRLSWRRRLRQVNGSRLKKTQRRQSGSSWGTRPPHDPYGASFFFWNTKKNSGSSKRLFHGDYRKRPATRSFETQAEQSQLLRTRLKLWDSKRHSAVNITREDILRLKRENSTVSTAQVFVTTTHFSDQVEQIWKSGPVVAYSTLW